MEVNTLREHTFKNYPEPVGGWNQYSDFWICGAGAVACYLLCVTTRALAWGWLYGVCKEKSNEDLRVQKTDKAVYSLYKAIYFSSAVIWGYIVLKDEDFIPPSLLGHGDLANIGKGFPRGFNYP
eukprot:CAMPEP_0202959142 /NCGR_PEP_ID=MMETSP1396-20130829/3416_1 /ASSEMBLY_ACC=CAM_ASM_000872 /TAXON_ID= /ORGANISM="Pseudokeronopsis sp., Strain Brazil" /LENGTH=123 /DNA_ID=CAMNT_0049677589 /DNA_START=165 /DNA_END=536 /DNA_ORIENTATION=+